ncbi:hypothetical protein C8J56DRAFT_909077 [Mycena floridula]|nr:hypothetical protein C8J56DRAFT_909077 [Mycena floridula]
MQPGIPNRMGLGLRPPLPSYGQGPSMSALAQQQQMSMHHFVPPSAQKQTTLFVGSISGGIPDEFLNELLKACGPLKSFKRLITPANKPQGFGFAEFEDPDAALRAIAFLQGQELPALEDGCANKKLLVKPDEKTRAFLDAYSSQRISTDADEVLSKASKTKVDALIKEINLKSQQAADSGLIDKEKYIIPPHLHDLQEADLPETQRGLVISEIAQFRERAAKREREKLKDVQMSIASEARRGSGANASGASANGAGGAPAGPKREWGKPKQQALGKAEQGYSKPVDFVKATTQEKEKETKGKTDEELEQDRKEARRRDEETSFRDRERRYEPRERQRLNALERNIARDRQQKERQDRDRVEMRSRLEIWDDDESDELFYVDRTAWRRERLRRLQDEEAADASARAFEEEETENLKKESEEFLAKQMDELQSLADEQRKAGLLLDDGAPVKLAPFITVTQLKSNQKETGVENRNQAAAVFSQAEEEEDAIKKRKVPLVKLDFSVEESAEQSLERLERIKESVPKDQEALFKAKVRWDGMSDSMIDRKLEPLVKRLMMNYLGEMEEDLIMFVLEHLKDHKGPQKLVEGLEPVLEEDAVELTINVWRQIIFESMAYGEGLHTDKMLVD